MPELQPVEPVSEPDDESMYAELTAVTDIELAGMPADEADMPEAAEAEAADSEAAGVGDDEASDIADALKELGL